MARKAKADKAGRLIRGKDYRHFMNELCVHAKNYGATTRELRDIRRACRKMDDDTVRYYLNYWLRIMETHHGEDTRCSQCKDKEHPCDIEEAIDNKYWLFRNMLRDDVAI